MSVVLTILSLLGCVVLLLAVEQGRIRSVVSPSAPAEGSPHPPAADGEAAPTGNDNELTRERAGEARTAL
ncbi:MAG TPA: hypothetical protein VGP38_09575, partial [Rubrobacter sp.]|nr:hypothetical protein [Rubrobacter sp.]